MKYKLFFVIILSLFALALHEGAQKEPKNTTQQTPIIVEEPTLGEHVTISRIVDGDTVELTDGTRIRYIGIDTPEIHPTLDCYGNEASDKNAELVLGKTVTMVRDVSETDKYNRLLRYVYLQDGTFVNEALVRDGFATAHSYPPDIAQQQTLRDAERFARENNMGLWSVCKN